MHGVTTKDAAAKVQKALEAIEGVTTVQVSDTGEVTVAVTDQAKTPASSLVKAIADAGFTGHAGGH